MSRIPLKLRTPAHFGVVSFLEAVAIENATVSRGYDKNIARLFNSLHINQGILAPQIDLSSRVGFLAKQVEPMRPVDFADVLLQRLLGNIYRVVLSSNEATRSAGSVIASRVRTDGVTDRILNMLPDIHAEVNEIFVAAISDYQKSVQAVIKAEDTATLAAAEVVKAANALKKAEDKNDSTVDAKRTKLAEVEAAAVVATNAVDSAKGSFEYAKSELASIRLLEAATRSLKPLATWKQNTVDQNIDIALGAFHSTVQWYPELFESEVAFADSLLISG